MQFRGALRIGVTAFAACGALGALAFGLLLWSIHQDVLTNCARAQQARPHPTDDVAALIDVVSAPELDLHQRNLAVWTLGRLGSSRALPVLEADYTGEPCSHETTLCQHELEKAIQRCGGTPAPRKTRGQ